MTYRIEYTKQAQIDLDEICRYIAFTLIAPDTAANMIRHIFESIRTLDSLPLRNPLVDDSPWKERGLRKLYVKNYIVFYTTQDSAVRIIRVMYGGRNVADQLKDAEE